MANEAQHIPTRALESIIEARVPAATLSKTLGDIAIAGTYMLDGVDLPWPKDRYFEQSPMLTAGKGFGGEFGKELHLPRRTVLDLFQSGALTVSDTPAKAAAVHTFCEKYGFTREQLQRGTAGETFFLSAE